MMKAIIITGTPGTGKKTLGKNLAKKLKYDFIDIHDFIKKNKVLIIKRDFLGDCDVIDINKFKKKVEDLIKKSKNKLVVSSHLIHNINKKYVDICFVTRCSPDILRKRLFKRGYSSAKIKVNVEAEAVDVCLIEALEKKHRACEIITTGTQKETLEKALKGLKSPKYGFVDWIGKI
ncbi:MAG: adenylate kinase family protein [Candidatus Nanoarchaeia archaeon]|nr:adenylate kinase family protein [Candidatus Nanoarchaeia archaeon]